MKSNSERNDLKTGNLTATFEANVASLNSAINEALSLGAVLNAVTSTSSDIEIEELAGTTDILEQRLRDIKSAYLKMEEAFLSKKSLDAPANT